jgi:hypothetical protein
MTKNYRAEFFTSADWAFRDIEAETPEQALKAARQFYADNLGELDFQSYDAIEPLDHVQIWDAERGTLASWESEDYRLRQAARDLLKALEQAVQALNTAPRFAVPNLDSDSYRIAAVCDRALAMVKGGQP